MGLENAALMLRKFCAQTPEADWPEFLRKRGAEPILAAIVDWESKPREPEVLVEP